MVYGPKVKEVVGRIWLAAEPIAGKRLKAVMSLWLPHDEAEHDRLSEAVRAKAFEARAATLDRLIKPLSIGVELDGARRRQPARPNRSRLDRLHGNGNSIAFHRPDD